MKILIIISSLIALVTGAIYGGPILLEKVEQKSQEYKEAAWDEFKGYVSRKWKKKEEEHKKDMKMMREKQLKDAVEDDEYCKEHRNDPNRSLFRCLPSGKSLREDAEEKKLRAQNAKEDQEKWNKKWAEDREKTFGDAAIERRNKAIAETEAKLMKNKNH